MDGGEPAGPPGGEARGGYRNQLVALHARSLAQPGMVEALTNPVIAAEPATHGLTAPPTATDGTGGTLHTAVGVGSSLELDVRLVGPVSPGDGPRTCAAHYA